VTDQDRRELVWPALGTDTWAARLDLASGLLTPATTTWRRKPVVLDARAHVMFAGSGDTVDLAVERANGWRTASVPLLRVTPGAVVVLPPDLLRALVAELQARRPRGTQDVVPALEAQVRYLERDGGSPASSPLTSRVSGVLDRIARLGLS